MSDLIYSPWSVRPNDSEYNRFYAGYVDCVPDGDLIPFMAAQLHRIQDVLGGLDVSQGDRSYESGKWTVRELMGHVLDTEWVFGSRLLRIARGDKAALPGMDQNDFMANSFVADRSMTSLIAEFSGLRAATMTLMDSLRAEVLDWKGNASGFDITVRAQGWVLAGHCEHHMTILKDRYGISDS